MNAMILPRSSGCSTRAITSALIRHWTRTKSPSAQTLPNGLWVVAPENILFATRITSQSGKRSEKFVHIPVHTLAAANALLAFQEHWQGYFRCRLLHIHFGFVEIDRLLIDHVG